MAFSFACFFAAACSFRIWVDSACFAAAFSCVVEQPAAPTASRQAQAATATGRIKVWLTEGTADVLPSPVLGGLIEQPRGAVVLDQVTEVHEGDVVGDPVGL